MIYLKRNNKNVKIIIDPFELFYKNKNVNLLIHKIAYKKLHGKKINYFLNLIFYIYYRSAKHTENLHKIRYQSYVHRDNEIYKYMSNQKNIHFDYEKNTNNSQIKNFLSKNI